MENKRDEKIWIFNAGDSFTGNPKWMFIYVNKFRKDIKAYWFCNSEATIQKIRKLGFKACSYKSKKYVKLQEKAGVFVSNQVKEVFPAHIIGAKFLNLWHGVGCKSIERALKDGVLVEKVAKKYIRYNKVYKNNQIFLVTSPIMEKHFVNQCGLEEDQLIRSGYPCCMHKKHINFSSFDHDILKQKGLSSDAKIAIYSPTFREKNTQNFIGRAFPDMEKLIKKLEELNMLLILKMHPLMEKDYSYQVLKEKYKDCKNLLFWPTENDVYEIFNKIDLAIVDYSSIFYDLLSAGVPNFIRYIFDYDDKENLREFVFDYKEMTCGKICNNFLELLENLNSYTQNDEQDKERIKKLFWEYDNLENGFEEIINKTFEFKIKDQELPTLHSYDIFDTLVTRKTIAPDGIFLYVRDKMEQSDLNFPMYLIKHYVKSRKESEKAVREYYAKTLILREDKRVEIQFHEIFDKIQTQYNLTDEQTQFLQQMELKAEYESIIPIEERINELKELVENGEDVVLISDMYLSKEVLKDILVRIDPIFETIPIFVSSEYGVQKVNGKLYFEVYKNIDYKYGKWIHCGDNKVSDIAMPKKLFIKTKQVTLPKLNNYEKFIFGAIKTYDGQVVTKLLRKNRQREDFSLNMNYAYSYASMYMVPYVSFILKDAIKRGIDTLYFISRDGHYLKIIADEIIKIKNYNIKTKYIYGSRKAWRVPSYIDKVDDQFFSYFGNFTGVTDINQLLEALNIDEENFVKIFPDLEYLLHTEKIAKPTLKACIAIFKDSEIYKEYLLGVAKVKREIVEKYLKQEIDFNENYAFIDYWARGYTQDCLARLINDITGKEQMTKFYYARSICPTEDYSERINFCTSTTSILFVEAIFSNLPYKSISTYKEINGRIEPEIVERTNNMKLHQALETELVRFCQDFYSNEFVDEDRTEKELFYAGIEWSVKSPTDKYILNCIASLPYTADINGEGVEFAPPITKKDIWDRIVHKKHFKTKTKSTKMSIARSSKKMKKLYNFAKKHKNIIKKIKF